MYCTMYSYNNCSILGTSSIIASAIAKRQVSSPKVIDVCISHGSRDVSRECVSASCRWCQSFALYILK